MACTKIHTTRQTDTARQAYTARYISEKKTKHGIVNIELDVIV